MQMFSFLIADFPGSLRNREGCQLSAARQLGPGAIAGWRDVQTVAVLCNLRHGVRQGFRYHAHVHDAPPLQG